MENYIKEDGYGQLISIIKKGGHYIAPAYHGIVRLDRYARVVEVGIEHNRTYKLLTPISFEVRGNTECQVDRVKLGRVRLVSGSLVRSCTLYTVRGKIRGSLSIDINNAGEIIVSFRADTVRMDITGNADICFRVGDGLVEALHSRTLKICEFESDSLRLAVSALDNVSQISVNNSKDIADVIVESDSLHHRYINKVTAFKITVTKA